jgi:manganese efflux pump family protein
MDLILILFLAIGLAMDTFALAIAGGISCRDSVVRRAITLGAFFGAFQAGMPILGWLGGAGVSGVVAGYAPWISFLLLVIVGSRMIYESLGESKECLFNPLTLPLFLSLSVATSIDSLAVGVSLGVLETPILVPAIMIGTTTFLLTAAGALIGSYFGHIFKNKMGIAGGLIIILIGVVILLEHLL